MRKLRVAIASAAIILFVGCSPKYAAVVTQGQEPTAFQHPSWSARSNVYEVNVRQFSQEGTFNAFAKSLPRLKEMGVEILWFMPITPIGLKDRKENESQLGSYYAVRNYTQVNPEFGTMDDFKRLVKEAHAMGFKVITDWVPNHTAPDNPWMTSHPDFYEHDANGKVVIPFDWTDTRQLNYKNRELRDSMIAAMAFWLRETDIDGFRCDVAHHVPTDFWKDCITQLKKIKDVYMLAEAEGPEFHYAGFDATYAWSLMQPMADVYSLKHNLKYFDSVLNHNINIYPKNAQRLFFTTNHDENSWNGTEFEKYGAAYKAFAVFTQTMYQSIPLIYNGQEEPNKRRLKFFVKDPIQWGKYEMAPFYSTLLHLRKRNKAMDADAYYRRLATANDDAIFAYVRQKGNKQVFVVLNLSPLPQHFTIKDKVIYGNPVNVFSGQKVKLFDHYVYEMQPWDYLVFEY
ncbi:MAG: alpha-glucosidase C-terminal domain-containing protein [Chitinophagaceae bacterium]|nr:alpha-glucosidase C-terminal domain-containing protein [Chitinophagaceae bacterium]MCW5914069.1 alpha-glucosidase C-terminal domain-containing protein [Chitinophagaceae bacterium]MCZ2396050.1 alpha-glucosidase C-terminal domain-containing protein [Chitinophagales bacterium]